LENVHGRNLVVRRPRGGGARVSDLPPPSRRFLRPPLSNGRQLECARIPYTATAAPNREPVSRSRGRGLGGSVGRGPM